MLSKIFPIALFVIAASSSICVRGQTEKKTFLKGGEYDEIKAGEFLASWWLCGPFPISVDSTSPTPEQQQLFFEQSPVNRVDYVNSRPVAINVGKKEIKWIPFTAPGRSVNLDSIFDESDFSAGYALARVTLERDQKALMMLGSDDAVRVWHNGLLVHENWVARGLTPDEDLVPLDLIKGENQILIKVQDVQQGWGFVARFADEKALNERITDAADRGQLTTIEFLLENGARADAIAHNGFTPLGRAEFRGRSEASALLKAKGATKTVIPAPEKIVAQYYAAVDGEKAPGISVLVAREGEVLFKDGFGDADIEKKHEISTLTKFRIGSITKQFTAAAILKLQEEGRLKVSDKLSSFFPDFPRGDEVTLHHLLTHTSGIHSYTGKPDFVSRVTSPVTSEELYQYFVNDPYDFSPGEQFRYNNSGYFLLGMIIEKVSGMDYARYLEKTFFAPLNMIHTGIYSSPSKLVNEAIGYTKENGVYTKAMDWNMSWAGAAGAMYSTVEDLHKWNVALYNGKVLSEKSLKEATTPVTLKDGSEPAGTRYGYGLFLGNYRGHEVISHGGGLHGFISQLAWYPDDKLSVVMLTNLTPSELNIDPNTLAEAFLWREMEGQSSYGENLAVADPIGDYVGRYDFRDGRVMIITAEGENLFAQLSGQARFPIYPSAPGEYFWKVVEAKIKFVRDEQGSVRHGHFEQGGFSIDAARLEDEKIVTIDPTTYQNYVGKYDFGNGMQLDVTAEQDKLFIQASNQPKFEILPLSATVFTVKGLNARVTFDEVAQGKSEKLVVEMAGQKTEAPRIVD